MVMQEWAKSAAALLPDRQGSHSHVFGVMDPRLKIPDPHILPPECLLVHAQQRDEWQEPELRKKIGQKGNEESHQELLIEFLLGENFRISPLSRLQSVTRSRNQAPDLFLPNLLMNAALTTDKRPMIAGRERIKDAIFPGQDEPQQQKPQQQKVDDHRQEVGKAGTDNLDPDFYVHDRMHTKQGEGESLPFWSIVKQREKKEKVIARNRNKGQEKRDLRDGRTGSVR